MVRSATEQVEAPENSFFVNFAAHSHPKGKVWLADYNNLVIKILGSSLSTKEISLS